MNTTEQLILAQRIAHYETSHVLHLVLTLISMLIGFGIPWYLPIWMLIALSNAVERGKIERKMRKLG
jgi:hypothetical protein